ncbi:MAG: FUSC family protein [Methylocystis sp.]
MPRSFIQRYRMQLGFCLRVTVAALSALTCGRLLGLPIILWAVLTAVILTQMSIGKSVKATIDYLLGTLGGAIYAGLIAVFVPHSSDAAFAAVLAIAIAPLALLAAMSPRFAAAPTTAAIVVLAPTLTHGSSLASAADRVIEVALGGSVALVVALLVFPTRARKLAKDGAADMLDLIADILPDLFSGFTQKSDADAIVALQRSVGAAFSKLDSIRAEAKHEQMTFLAVEPDFDPLRHSLLRLRHDLIMIGRAATAPLPEALQGRVGPLLTRVANAAVEYLRKCGAALRTGGAPPALEKLDEAFDAFAAEIATLRREGQLRELSVEAVEYVFALSFALEQWRRDLQDVARRVSEQADRPMRHENNEKG